MKSYVYHSATATAHALIEHLIAMKIGRAHV